MRLVWQLEHSIWHYWWPLTESSGSFDPCKRFACNVSAAQRAQLCYLQRTTLFSHQLRHADVIDIAFQPLIVLRNVMRRHLVFEFGTGGSQVISAWIFGSTCGNRVTEYDVQHKTSQVLFICLRSNFAKDFEDWVGLGTVPGNIKQIKVLWQEIRFSVKIDAAYDAFTVSHGRINHKMEIVSTVKMPVVSMREKFFLITPENTFKHGRWVFSVWFPNLRMNPKFR